MSDVRVKYFNPDNLKLAYLRVVCWNDKTVKDRVGIRAFGVNLEENCKVLSKKICDNKYNPSRGFKFYVPKPSYTLRTKTLLYIEDAILYQAIANKIAEKSYGILKQQEQFVFGSVLNPNVQIGEKLLNTKEPNFFFFKFWQSLFQKFKESVIQSIEVDKVKYKFETDITGFFDCIPHYNLLEVLSSQFKVEDEILDILSNCLNIWSGTRDGITPGVGIPQGPVPSFLFANLLLHGLDEKIINKGLKYYRYMDDIKIYGYDETELKYSLIVIDKYLKSVGLSINSKKTSIEKIDEEKEDATIKELKKMSVFGSYDEIDFNIPIAYAENDIGNVNEDPVPRLNGMKWALKNLVPGGILITTSNVANNQLGIDVDILASEFDCKTKRLDNYNNKNWAKHLNEKTIWNTISLMMVTKFI